MGLSTECIGYHWLGSLGNEVVDPDDLMYLAVKCEVNLKISNQ
jgi:hypothetical protein